MLSATVTDNSGMVASVSLSYRQGGQAPYTQVPMAPSGGDTYQGSIPGSAVTVRGLEYFLQASDPGGNTTTSEVNRVAVSVTDLVSRQTLPPASYRMVSLPLRPGDGSPQTILVDDLGPYDTTRWRFGRWSPSENAYHECTFNWSASTDDFAPGRGYWLITRDGGSFDVSGTSVPIAAPYSVLLQPWWNQIGNPFAFPVDWRAVSKDPVISDSLWDYTGSGYGITTLMQPWRGYWVENRGSSAVNVLIPPVEAAGATLVPAVVSHDILWEISLYASCDGVTDCGNRLGVALTASDGLDPLDVREPPPPWTHAWLYFSPDGRAPYASDFKAPFLDGASWEVSVALAGVEGSATVWVEGVEAVPEEFSVRLLDTQEGRVVDLRQTPAYEFLPERHAASRRLHLLAGVRAYVDEVVERLLPVPAEYQLAQNQPNPVLDRTEIRFQIPMVEGRAPQWVRLTVFDTLGRQVAVLLDGERGPGFHSVTWDACGPRGRSVPSGLHVYRMETQRGWAHTRKLVVLRGAQVGMQDP